MKYRSKKGTIITIPDGLSAKEIAAIKADADAGYGTRAQNTANALGKKLGTNPSSKKKKQDPAVNNDGSINQDAANKQIRNARNETITDQFGNKRTVRVDPDTGEVTIVDEAGGAANKFKDLAEAAAATWNGDVSRQKAYDAEFSRRTQYLDRNRQREEEEAKQELSNRGIPYNPDAVYDSNTNNLYGKTIGAIKENYQNQYRTAADEATLAGNQAYATDASARDSFLNALSTGATTFGGRWQPYNNTGGQDTQGVIGLTVEQIMTKYGIDRDEALKRMQIANQGRGGGGGSEGGGFEIAG